MTKLFIPNLAISVTDRCNLNCAHCVCGEKRNIDISDNVLRNIFSEVGYISNLAITGGEPFMVKERLEKILEFLKDYQVKVEQFGLTTNGTLYNEEIEELFDQYEEYLSETPMTYQQLSKMRAYIDFSNDEYHQKEIIRLGNYKYQKNIADLHDSKYFNYTKHLNKGIYNLGNAKNIVIMKHRKIKKPKLYVFPDKEYTFIGPFVNISTEGYILRHTVSNNFELKDTYGHVSDDSIYNLLLPYAKRCRTVDEFYKKTDKEVRKILR